MPSESSNAVTFSFEGGSNNVSEAALQAAVAVPDNPDYQAGVQETTQPVETQTEAAPAEAKPALETPAPEAKAVSTQPSAEELKTYTITVDGQEMTVTEADLKAGHMRHRDYTQKTQKLAESQRAWEAKEAEYQNNLAQIDAFLRDQSALDAYRAKAFGQSGQANQQPQFDQSRPPTFQDVATISAHNAEQIRLSLLADQAETRQIAQSAIQAQQNLQREKVANELDSHISTIMDRFPVLKKFDDIAEDLIGDASKRLPKGASVAEAKAQITQAAERRMAVIQSLSAETKKASAVQAAKIKASSPEPPGGTPSAQRQGKKLTLNASDQKDFRAAALADVQAFIDANS